MKSRDEIVQARANYVHVAWATKQQISRLVSQEYYESARDKIKQWESFREVIALLDWILEERKLMKLTILRLITYDNITSKDVEKLIAQSIQPPNNATDAELMAYCLYDDDGNIVEIGPEEEAGEDDA